MINTVVYGTCLSATHDLLFHACLLGLSHSGQHERTTVRTFLLCAGPIEGCPAVALSELVLCLRSIRRREEQVQKQKLRVCLWSSEAIWLAELMIQLPMTAVSLQEEHLPSSHVHLAVGTPQCPDLD